MTRSRALVGFIGAALLLGSSRGEACGDKLLVVGRGVRAGRAQGVTRPASIVLYVNPKGTLPAALTESRLDAHLRKAGHSVRSVETRQELTAALNEGTADVVVTDIADVAALESDVRGAPSKPALLPVIYNPTGQELKAAEKKYACVMKAPSKNQDYLEVIDDALALRAKEAKKR